MNKHLQLDYYGSTTTIFTRDIILLTPVLNIWYTLTITSLNRESHLSDFYEVTFTYPEINIPIHLPLIKINREYIGNKPKTFYMSIPSTQGTLFVHQYDE